MSLKMTFLGTGAAFTVGENNFQSNVLFELNNDTLLLDAGSDLRLSLFELKKNHRSIYNVYISHLHSDHIGGLEWLALTTFFDPNYSGRPTLFTSQDIVSDLWNKSLSGGLRTLSDKRATLDDYFDPQIIAKNGSFQWQNIDFKLIQMIHVYNDFYLMPCYGVLFEYNSTVIFYTADTQYQPDLLNDAYQKADIIFHDCETSKVKSSVHAHYSDLVQLPVEIKQKMWLYHYNNGVLPDAKADGFKGFVTKGQCFEF